MKVIVSEHYYQEKEYALRMLFNEFLNLAVTFEYSENNIHTEILLDNGKVIIIEDHFFHHFKNTTYLKRQNIPTHINESTIDFLDSLPFLSLYGPAKVLIEKERIRIKGDIIAATFFMLSRWEEAVISVRDKYGRFPASESLAVKHDFIHRPVVNEYVEILWSAINLLDHSVIRKQRDFNFLLTHDVDLPRMWWSPKDFIKSLGGAILKRKSISEAYDLTKRYIKGKDPFNVFNWMMDLSEKFGHMSHFFFMSGGTSNKDNYYKIEHPKIKKLLLSIKKRGHKIGFHPSFNAFNDKDQFNKELQLLKKVSQSPIVTGRQHFLRFEVPTTWQIWEDSGMEWDSTMSFHDKEGFRCGVCYPFPAFNIKTRQQLRLIERPLIVMEGSFITYQKATTQVMTNKIKQLIDTVKVYQGEFVLLWHNSAFRNKDFNDVYIEILKYANEIGYSRGE